MTPFRIIGELYYVGAEGLSSFLIRTPEGLILIDGALPESAPLIEANITRLGFSLRDVRIILMSHEHFDHAGGLAQLRRDTGARLVASAPARDVLRAGRVGYGPSASTPIPTTPVDRVIADGDTVGLGGVTLTAHLTPGHTPGCTSWTMPLTDSAGHRHNVIFHCSTTVAGQSLAPEAYHGMVANYRRSFAAIARINADVLLAPHGDFFDLAARRARLQAGDAEAFVDPQALQRFNTASQRAFEADLARQTTARR